MGVCPCAYRHRQDIERVLERHLGRGGAGVHGFVPLATSLKFAVEVQGAVDRRLRCDINTGECRPANMQTEEAPDAWSN